jgi:arginase family enzyme
MERSRPPPVQVGCHQRPPPHQFRRFGVGQIEMRHWRDDLRLDLKTRSVSLDIDGLDPAMPRRVAPGAGRPSLRQVINLLHGIDQSIVGADIVDTTRAATSPHDCDRSATGQEIAGMMVNGQDVTSGR